MKKAKSILTDEEIDEILAARSDRDKAAAIARVIYERYPDDPASAWKVMDYMREEIEKRFRNN